MPLLLSLGGGFLLFISIFAGEFENRWDFFAGGAAALLGLVFAALMGARGCIVAPVLIAVGVFGGWVWEQFRDGASIDAVTFIGGAYSYLGSGTTDRNGWVTCTTTRSGPPPSRASLEVLSPEGDVIGTVDVTATRRASERRPARRGRHRCSLPHEGSRSGGTHGRVLRNLRGTCTTEIG